MTQATKFKVTADPTPDKPELDAMATSRGGRLIEWLDDPRIATWAFGEGRPGRGFPVEVYLHVDADDATIEVRRGGLPEDAVRWSSDQFIAHANVVRSAEVFAEELRARLEGPGPIDAELWDLAMAYDADPDTSTRSPSHSYDFSPDLHCVGDRRAARDADAFGPHVTVDRKRGAIECRVVLPHGYSEPVDRDGYRCSADALEAYGRAMVRAAKFMRDARGLTEEGEGAK